MSTDNPHLGHIITRMGMFVSPCFTKKMRVEEFADTTVGAFVIDILSGKAIGTTNDEHLVKYGKRLLEERPDDVERLIWDSDDGTRLYRFFSPNGGLPLVKVFKRDFDANEYSLGFDDFAQAMVERFIDGYWCEQDDEADWLYRNPLTGVVERKAEGDR